ncbi:MAG: DJ-1/PfpI family protein [Steroidobacteraceae bacterium]|jgi:putative intracellular protease/amidase
MSLRVNLREFFLWAIVCAALGSTSLVLADQSPVPPKKVAILIFNDVAMIDYSGPYEVFSHAGYDVYAVAATKHSIRSEEGLEVVPKYSFADAPQADIVVIPGGGYEAPGNSAAAAWIKRQNAHDEHTMSVCNGAFTLANTGLLNGLSATTTAGNILRMRRTYAQINVVNDQRVVDNGKILTTAGLSAGIDGALHMVAVLDGEDTAQTIALMLEYNWQPNNAYVRGAMADQLIPDLDLKGLAELVDMRLKGDKDRWETAEWFKTKLSADDLFGAVQTAFQKAYAEDGPWGPGSFHLTSSGPLKANLHFDDRGGHHWRGTLMLEAVPSDAHQFVVRIATTRVDGDTRLQDDARSTLLPSALPAPDLKGAHWAL